VSAASQDPESYWQSRLRTVSMPHAPRIIPIDGLARQIERRKPRVNLMKTAFANAEPVTLEVPMQTFTQHMKRLQQAKSGTPAAAASQHLGVFGDPDANLW
jgi:hypothetical protein